MFPTFQPPRCEEDLLGFLGDLSVWRARAIEPLKFPQTLTVVDQCANPRPPLGHTETSDAPKVPERHQPKRRMRVFPELSSPKEMRVVLEGELQTGYGRWSQVYASKLTIGRRTCDVVVKLYRECMFREPDSTNFYGSEGIFEGDWPSGTEVAQREAWAYKRLQRYQGSTVPYSYGFYTFKLESDGNDPEPKNRETIVGFVMEKLSGLKVEDFFMLNDHHRNAKMLLADALAWSIHELHCAGVTHSDVTRNNMRILTDNGPDSLYVILFDLSNAAPKFNYLGKPTLARDAGRITRVAIGDDDDDDSIEACEAWKARHRTTQPAWVEMFRVDDYLCL